MKVKLALNKFGEITVYREEFKNDYVIILEDGESVQNFAERAEKIEKSKFSGPSTKFKDEKYRKEFKKAFGKSIKNVEI